MEVLPQATVAGESAGSYALPAATASTELVRANGWTVETRVKVGGNTGDLFGLLFQAADDVGGVGFLLRPNEIQAYDTSWASYPTPKASIPITLDYHDIRIQVAPGSSNADIFVDDMVTPAATIALSSVAGAQLSSGDFSSGSTGVAHWDHVVVNAAAPAPTPLPGTTGWAVDVTFEADVLPTDFGMTAGGNVDPTPSISNGMWNVDLQAGEHSSWKATDFASHVTDTIIHGFAEIDQATLTGTANDQTVIGLGTDLVGSISFTLGITDGGMSGIASSSVTGYGPSTFGLN